MAKAFCIPSLIFAFIGAVLLLLSTISTPTTFSTNTGLDVVRVSGLNKGGVQIIDASDGANPQRVLQSIRVSITLRTEHLTSEEWKDGIWEWWMEFVYVKSWIDSRRRHRGRCYPEIQSRSNFLHSHLLSHLLALWFFYFLSTELGDGVLELPTHQASPTVTRSLMVGNLDSTSLAPTTKMLLTPLLSLRLLGLEGESRMWCDLKGARGGGVDELLKRASQDLWTNCF